MVPTSGRRDRGMMECPECGYLMTALDAECPRCRLRAQRAAQQPPPPPAPAVAPGPQEATEPQEPAPVAVAAIAARLASAAPLYIETGNTSGTIGAVPREVRMMGWCWGGFAFPLPWGMANQVWASLVCLAFVVPWVGWALTLGVGVWFGLQGHELAWRNRRFDSMDEYRLKMRAWDLAGVWACPLGIVFGVLGWFMRCYMWGENASGVVVSGVVAGLATAGSVIMATRVSNRIRQR